MNRRDCTWQWPRGGKVWIVVLLFLPLVFGACGSDSSSPSDGPASLQRAVLPDSMTISRMLETDDRFSTLQAALDSTGLDSLLATSGPYTLFAPPNKAFQALPPGTMETLLKTRHDRLRTIIAHHIVEKRLPTGEGSAAQTVTTLSGDTLSLRPDPDESSVGGVPIVDGNIEAANGLIHVLERVLPPPNSPSAP